MLCADIHMLLLKIHSGEYITQQCKQGSPKHSSIFNKKPIFPPAVISLHLWSIVSRAFCIWFGRFSHCCTQSPDVSLSARECTYVFGLPSFMRADSQQCWPASAQRAALMAQQQAHPLVLSPPFCHLTSRHIKLLDVLMRWDLITS